MFEKILIANRGAIAIRIARTCERLGIATVAVCSEVEKDSLHAQTCDEVVCVGPARVQDSYLNKQAIIEAAKATGAQAIHPGYGLLSENATFVREVEAAGLAFIGPSADAIELFGDKVRARQLARHAGVRITPGTDEVISGPDFALAAAEGIGYPVLVKAAGGGGGIGIQIANDPDELVKVLDVCANRARAAFGDDRLYLERFLERPRHVEVQVLGDKHGQVVALGERECSIQRRHQKVIEESPAPALLFSRDGEDRRLALFDAACRIAQEAGYYGAGTCEFILDSRGGFYFMEWNPRLQVEHALTEMCTGLDLVELQLRIAIGEALPNGVLRAESRGHAVEARIYAEDPARDFIPKPGEVKNLRWPTLAPGTMRIETGIGPGSIVTPYYDPMVAKVIAFGTTRHGAILTLDRVLAESEIEPLVTNMDFLRRVLAHEAFRAGQYDTEFVQRMFAEEAERIEAATEAAAPAPAPAPH
ncbi:MAG TPA: biotin carboxylase N-terminal domain-containing protein [Polyangiales bacterium]|nr:biotin carboxylase N-terminal domain-containing protein [Polyangiales bacterium]